MLAVSAARLRKRLEASIVRGAFQRSKLGFQLPQSIWLLSQGPPFILDVDVGSA